MTDLHIQKESIQPRLDGIQGNLAFLKTSAALSLQEFARPEIVERVQHHLRLALEGVFNITSHILSRIPGTRETEYKKMARRLGEVGIVDADFANTKLVAMAGYRNRLTHFYASIGTEELYHLTNTDLGDIETFLSHIKTLMQHPEKFGLIVA